MKLLRTFTALVLLLSALTYFCIHHRTEHSRTADPTGRYTAICSYSSYLSCLPMAPGLSSDKSCYVRIVDTAGQDYGEIPVPMIQLAAVTWQPTGAEIRNVGEWSFPEKTCYYWSEDGSQKITLTR
jgi:hypothetical protein